MRLKKIIFLIVLIIYIVLFTGCNTNISEDLSTSMDAPGPDPADAAGPATTINCAYIENKFEFQSIATSYSF